MSRIGTAAPNPDDESAIKAASDVIESEQENVRIEIQFAKAIRVGMMLRTWRKLMVDGPESGENFPEDWVNEATMNIFYSFFPPYEPNQEIIYGRHDDD